MWKKTSIFLKMEDNLNFFENGRRTQYFLKMEDDLNIFESGGRPQLFRKWKTVKNNFRRYVFVLDDVYLDI